MEGRERRTECHQRRIRLHAVSVKGRSSSRPDEEEQDDGKRKTVGTPKWIAQVWREKKLNKLNKAAFICFHAKHGGVTMECSPLSALLQIDKLRSQEIEITKALFHHHGTEE